MTIVLKSNVVATKSLGHISGISGPTDYSGMIDFVNGRMVEDYVEKNIFSANSLTLSNQSSAHYYGLYDRENNTIKKLIPQTELLANLHYLGDMGLVASGYTSNWMAEADGYLTATKTQTFGANASNKLVTLQVFGTGSVTLSGGVTSQGQGLTATYGNPITVLTGTNPTITASVSGAVLHYQITPTTSVHNDLVVAYTSRNLGVYTKPATTPKPQCTLVFNAQVYSYATFNSASYQLLFSVKMNTGDYLAILLQGSQLRVAFISSRDATVPATMTPLSLGNTTVVVTLQNNKVKVFFGEQKIFDFTATAAIALSSIDFIKSGATAAANGLDGTVKKLFTYDRAVSDAEAMQLTNSFKF